MDELPSKTWRELNEQISSENSPFYLSDKEGCSEYGCFAICAGVQVFAVWELVTYVWRGSAYVWKHLFL